MTRERFQTLVSRFSTLRIGVIGDFFLDKYIEIDPSLDEPSLETGRPAHQVVRIRTSPGAGGNVATDFAALGVAELRAVGVIGDDGEGYDLATGLERIGCSTEHLLRHPGRMTPAYMKPRDIITPGLAGERERYDIRSRTATPPDAVRYVIEAANTLLPHIDALAIVDQIVDEDYGVVTSEVRRALSEAAPRYPGVVFFADSRSRTLDFANIITKPNRSELPGVDAQQAEGAVTGDNSLIQAVREARRMNNAPLFVTLGGEGIMVSDPEPRRIPGFTVEGPTDITGAGDAAAAAIVCSLASGASHEEAALLGNLAASVSVEKLGECGSCSLSELDGRFAAWILRTGGQE